MSDILTFDDIDDSLGDAVGGKGLSLALLSRAGFPVPPGFCVTSDAFRRHAGKSLSDSLVHSLNSAYRQLGGIVAVRSSATAEDGATASFAGQQETYLGISGERDVCDAVERCWASLNTERATAYRAAQGVAEMAMAVVVQRLVAAESAGVLFTCDPMDPANGQMIVEASWGLGETVVSGRVTPDRFVITRDGTVVERHLGQKSVERDAAGERPVARERQQEFCLTDEQLTRLAELGRHVEAHFGSPRDVEWAWADGQAWLLQARPITTAGAGEREAVQHEETESLRTIAEPSGTVWGRFNLSEVLAEPTPMTWSLMRLFLSGAGGYGRMYADLGFPPPPDMADECGYDLVCGRPYMNLSHEPRMQWGKLPFRHDFAALKANPAQVPYSVAEFTSKGTGIGAKLRSAWRILKGGWKYRAEFASFAQRFRNETIPEFLTATSAGIKEDWAALDAGAVANKFTDWSRRALVEFARESLKPTVFAAGSMATIQRMLEKTLGVPRARLAVAEMCAGVRPDAGADLPGALRDIARHAVTREKFVEDFGHRGSREMELAEPRWNEDSAALDRVIASADAAGHFNGPTDIIDRLAAEAKLNPIQKSMLRIELQHLRTALALRETGKHHLLRGYAMIRRALQELNQRHALAGGIYFLTRDELPRLVAGENFATVIESRRRRRRIALSIEVPPVIFSDDLDAIGRPSPLPDGSELLHGMSLSAGVAEGPAMVLTDPRAAPPAMSDYVLVCPSTDPSWVPLFARAKALVMETGGVLSHGAIVAREFGLPAVAGLPDATRRLTTGTRLRVDGNAGTVAII